VNAVIGELFASEVMGRDAAADLKADKTEDKKAEAEAEVFDWSSGATFTFVIYVKSLYNL
jgi:hypothetical protein